MLLRDAVKAFKDGRRQLPRGKLLTEVQNQASDFLLNAVTTGTEVETAWHTFESYIPGGWRANPMHALGKQLWEAYLQSQAMQATFMSEGCDLGQGRHPNTRAINSLRSAVQNARRKWSIDFQDDVDQRLNKAMLQVFKAMEEAANCCERGRGVPVRESMEIVRVLEVMTEEDRGVMRFASSLRTDWDIFFEATTQG